MNDERPVKITGKTILADPVTNDDDAAHAFPFNWKLQHLQKFAF